MDNLQRLIQLAKADNGKFFVIDEQGNPSLVIMAIEEYEKVLLRKVASQVQDIEDINRKILEAQKIEKQSAAEAAELERQSYQDQLKSEVISEVIDSTFSFESENPYGPTQELEDI